MKRIIHKVITFIILLTGMISVTYADGIEEPNTHKYAVIINAVSDSAHNYMRYWNDCSAVYQTLLAHEFLGPNIYVAMSDGTSSNNDIMQLNGSYCSSPLDLNGDGTNDIQYSANRDYIEYIFSELADIITDDDDLFIFTVGEGGVDVYNSAHSSNDGGIIPYIPVYTNYLVLWGGYQLTDADFAQLLAPISARTINIVMQQDNSGGFIDNLRGWSNIVITTSSGIEGSSNPMEDESYDDFIYHWLSAVNGFAPSSLYPFYNAPIITDTADRNQDGYISMEEAYMYADAQGTYAASALMESHPHCLGQSLTLDDLLDFCGANLLVPGWDLYMKDNSGDNGEEPNITTEYSWISEDIWFEENGHKITVLQSGETYDVCVNVRNRGNMTSPNNAELYVHWTKATIGGSWPYGWYGQYTYDCNGHSVRRGDLIGSIVLPPIESGETYVARIPWTTPLVEEYVPCLPDLDYNAADLWHYCVLARIVDEQEQPDEMTDMGLKDLVLNYNNVISKNLTIMSPEDDDSHLTGIVAIANPLEGEDSGPYTLSCIVFGWENWEQLATIRLTFPTPFYNSQPNMTWAHCQTNNIYGSFDLEDGAQFEGIYFSGNDNGTYPVKLEVIYDEFCEIHPNFTIFLFLDDWNGDVVGGETFYFSGDHNSLVNHIRTSYTNRTGNNMEQQLTLSDEDVMSIDVYNAQGMHLKHCDNCDMQSLNLPKGIYIYRIQDENRSYTRKVIK